MTGVVGPSCDCGNGDGSSGSSSRLLRPKPLSRLLEERDAVVFFSVTLSRRIKQIFATIRRHIFR